MIRKLVNFELSQEMEKDVFFILSWVWDKTLRPSDLQIPPSNALPLKQRDCMASKAIKKFLYDRHPVYC